jgi:putative acetyltransferase
MVTLREFGLGDEPALQAVFHSSIHCLAVRDYTTEQLDALAPTA